MNSENFVVIQGWMCNELELKGNDLLVYALIYGFSQDGESVFSGGRNYIAKTFNISLPTVDKALNNLIDRGLIEKIPYEVNNVTFNNYKISLVVVKNLYGGSKETLPNNINNNKNVIVSKDTITNGNSEFQFGKVETKPKKPKVSPNTAEYNDAMFMVTTYTDNSDLKKELIKLVNMKKDMASKERYKFYASTIKNYLDCLDETFGDDEVLKIEAVKLSIRYNGTTKVMIPNSTPNNKCVDNVQSEHKKDYKPALDENGNPIVF